MKIEYVRNMQSSFMRLKLEHELSKTEQEMLSQNQIIGILNMNWQKEDETYQLRYDITGKQALDAILENQMAGEELLMNLVSGICQVCRRLERYLLSPEGIQLCPEMIYWDYKQEMMNFCYYPDGEKTLQEQFVHLMEYMLTKTDHKNVHAVEIAYGVYEELQKPSYSLGAVMERIEQIRESWREESAPPCVEETGEGNDEMVLDTRKERATELEEKVYYWKTQLAEKMKEVQMYMVSWIKPGEGKHIKRKKERESFVFVPEEEVEQQGLPTVLLSECKEEIEGILKYEGKQDLPNLPITTLPFLIGKAKECDGIIQDATISKRHARITKVDDVYFIEDLNSSNGTKVNGGLLTYKTRVSLKKNERVYFANQPYRFL